MKVADEFIFRRIWQLLERGELQAMTRLLYLKFFRTSSEFENETLDMTIERLERTSKELREIERCL